MTDQDEINFLGDLQRIEVKPDDLFVLSTDKCLSHDSVERIKQYWAENVPNTKVVIVSDGFKLGVIGKKYSDGGVVAPGLYLIGEAEA